jgi:hypothetical protein
VYDGPSIDIVPAIDMTISARSPNGQSHSLERRSLLRWFGTASLILPLAACANSTPPRQYSRPPSHITGKDHRNGGV